MNNITEGYMLQDLSAVKVQGCGLSDLCQTDTNIELQNITVASPMLEKMDTVENTSEYRIDIPSSEQNRSSRPGWLKCLLTGVVIIAGSGGLMAANYYDHKAGIIANDHGLKNLNVSHPVENLPVTTNLPSLNNTSSEETAYPATGTAKSVSPYSYYEEIYSSTTARNNVLKSASLQDSTDIKMGTVTKEKSEIVISVPGTTEHSALKSENEKKVVHNILPLDIQEYFKSPCNNKNGLNVIS